MKMNLYKEKRIGYTGDSVIKRGYEIYDEWIERRYSSRKIVHFIERTVASIRENTSNTARLEALSCLFALDIRIKEKYGTLLQCLFSYFSWRRERRAFQLLKGAFNIKNVNDDIRTLIEVELQILREKLGTEAPDDTDDDTVHGGKRNGKAQEESTKNVTKEQDKATNDNPESLPDKEETNEFSENKTEEISESSEMPERIVDSEASQKAEESSLKDAHVSVKESKEQEKGKNQEIKEEKNVSKEKSEPSTDKTKQAKTYNDAGYLPTLHDETLNKKTSDSSRSFIDEVILDNMVKYREDNVEHAFKEDKKQIFEPDIKENIASQSEDVGKSTDKNEDLYDKMPMRNGEVAKPVEKNDRSNPTQTVSETQKENAVAKAKNDNDMRVPLRVDITVNEENEMRREISNSMSVEAIKAIYESQAAIMREQLNIASEEVGINAPVEIIGRPEAGPPEQSVAGPNRK